MSLTRPESVFDVTRRKKIPSKNVGIQELVQSKDFATDENGMSMTIGNGDSEDEDESLIEPPLKSGIY